MNELSKACKYCTKTFTPKRKDTMYCCRSCQQQAYKKRKRNTISLAKKEPSMNELKEKLRPKINELGNKIQDLQKQVKKYLKLKQDELGNIQQQILKTQSEETTLREVYESEFSDEKRKENDKQNGQAALIIMGINGISKFLNSKKRISIEDILQKRINQENDLVTNINNVQSKITSLRLSKTGIDAKFDKKINPLNTQIKELEEQKSTLDSSLIHIKLKEIKAKKHKSRTDIKFLSKYNPNYQFKGKWKQFIGNPTNPFHILVYGSAGQGKSHFCVQLTKYLSDNFGLLLFVSAEEGTSNTFVDKLDRYNVSEYESKFVSINSHSVDEIEDSIKELQPKFVVIDSLTTCNISDKQLERLKNLYTNVSFITITQATQQGKARGGTDYEHNCQMVVRIEGGKAFSKKNRFSDSDSKKQDFNIFP